MDYAADTEKLKALTFYETGIPETQEAKANENVECNLQGRQCEFVAQGGTIGDAGPDGGTSHSLYINQTESLIITQKVVPIYPSGVYRRLLAGADVGEARASGVLAELICRHRALERPWPTMAV